LIDATLSATRASGVFTQDLEDIEIDLSGSAPAADRAAAVDRAPAPDRTPVFTPATPPSASSQAPAFPSADGGNALTDAQHRAILAIASRVFGRAAEKVDYESLAGKPLEQLSKGEASALIDRLRGMQSEQLNQREAAPTRGGQPGIRNGVVQR